MYRGFYINLERNENRRNALTRHLAAIGAAARYQRIQAVDGRAVAHQFPTTLDPGNLGLWLSHLKLLEANRDSTDHLHILEDDAILAHDSVVLFERILAQADSQLDHWDLIFTDLHVPRDAELFVKLSQQMRASSGTRNSSLVDLRSIDLAGTSSVFLNRNSIKTYAELISGQWAIGRPIDLYIRDLVHRGQLKAYLTVPFLTSLSRDTGTSDILGAMDRSRAVATIYRRAFFIDADLQSLNAELLRLTADVPSLDAQVLELSKEFRLSPLAAIFVRSMLFALSDQWVQY